MRFQNTHLTLDERKVQEFQSTLIESILPGHQKSNDVPLQHNQSSSNPHATDERTVKVIETPPIDPTDGKVSTSPWNWSGADIHHWFEQQHISSEIRDLYQFKTGAQMIAYAETLTDGWHKQYERYASRYTQQNPGKELPEHEFALFASSLKQLASKDRDILSNLSVLMDYSKIFLDDHARENQSSHPQPSVRKETTRSNQSQKARGCILL